MCDSFICSDKLRGSVSGPPKLNTEHRLVPPNSSDGDDFDFFFLIQKFTYFYFNRNYEQVDYNVTTECFYFSDVFQDLLYLSEYDLLELGVHNHLHRLHLLTSLHLLQEREKRRGTRLLLRTSFKCSVQLSV